MEEELRRLIAEVRAYPSSSPQRRKALNKLLMLTQKLRGIYRSTHPNYLDALDRTFEWVCKNIDVFNLERSYVVWFNGYLKWRIRDLYISDNEYIPSLDQPVANEDELRTLGETIAHPKFSLSGIDLLLKTEQEEQRQRQGKAVWEYIKQDPAGKLTQCHLQKDPQCHCQLLAQEILLHDPPKKIAQIARELNIKNQTLYSHWNRHCIPLLREIALIFEPKP
ncbi:MAG: hypothetical protein DSM107014_14320 [Gomphosphaeria aponina SAG 52.96 = DSM 107014]|uniref:Uncharacterized protein n=1 Tax=Gomphosphaeria aponina SAG 52.96 = DSM 107014 TaxID=1521640 RepID=A0A941GWG4_9CHRO|nr:hypothetical protein [Gomphosphaeria aponina SAG 52.96 = DSM 107014]